MRYLICYDVTEDERRNQIARRLEDLGFRVQYSVFECKLTPALYATLKNALLQIMDTEEGDRLHCYPLCGACAQLVERFGQPIQPQPDDALIF